MQTTNLDNQSMPPAIVSWDEVKVGKLIGRGAFSAVYCTDKKDNWSSSSLNFDDSSNTVFFDEGEEETTKATQGSDSEALSGSSSVSEDSRFVLKCLNASSRSGKTHKAMAARGLINEASILMSLAPHPNVTRLVGVSTEVLNANPDKGFLVFDRIADSLDRILVRWNSLPDGSKARHQSLSNILSPSIQWKDTALLQTSPLEWRLRHLVLGMANGLAFLHKNSILHRDFKPSNVGVSYDGTIRILDLGSARRLPVPGEFELTKGVGTRRYMAPEVDCSSIAHDYGYPADVFSFSIVFWEVLTQRKAFDEYRLSTRQEVKHAMYRDHERPRLDLEPCESFHDVLFCGWDHDPSVRPTMEDMICRIEAELYGDGPLSCWHPDERLRKPSKLFFL